MRSRQPVEVTLNYWSVFTDAVLASLLILIMFIFAQFLANSKVLVRMTIEKRQKAMKSELMATVPNGGDFMTIGEDGNLQRIRFSDAILFDQGRDRLKTTGKAVLDVVGRRLLAHAEWVSSIQIEGHTDAFPINTPRFQSNWELSSARATSVVRFLQDHVGLDPEQYPLSATGRAEYVPVVDVDIWSQDPDLRNKVAINRRVEVILAYSEQGLTW